MIVAKVEISRTVARTIWAMPIPTGLKGGQIQIVYKEPVWDDLIKLYIFNDHLDTSSRVLPTGLITIPTEECVTNQHLRFGIYGMDASGDTIIPTVYADLGIVKPSADPGDDPGLNPDLPVWAQILAAIGNPAKLFTKCKRDLVCGINEIFAVANSALAKAQKVTDQAENGDFNGKPGFSPYATVTQTETGADITVTDAAGTTTAQIMNGQDGKNGRDGPTPCFATCTAPAAPPSTTPVTWYVPKTMPRPSGTPGMLIDVFWQFGRASGLGYDVTLVWGSEGGADNETIVTTSSTTDSLTGEHSIPTEGTVRYQLEEANGRTHWRYVSGPLLSPQFSSASAADAADKIVPGMEISYLPGMEIYVQLDQGNTASAMWLVPDDGPTLPVYGNGTGRETGPIPAGYILHIKNAGDHWQIINSTTATAPELYLAVYGTNTYADILQAYKSLKYVLVYDSEGQEGHGGLICTPVRAKGPRSNPTDFVFSCPISGGEAAITYNAANPNGKKGFAPIGGSANAVLYTPQELTPEQQEQVRKNIGLINRAEVGA